MLLSRISQCFLTIVYYLVAKYLKFTSKDNTKTNVYSLVGKKAIVIEDINWVTGTGQIKCEGQVWSAKTAEEINIPKGSEVEIQSIEGVKVIVTPLKYFVEN